MFRAYSGLFALSLLVTGCHDTGLGKSVVSVVGKGVVNDPSNKSLRFDLIRFGLSEFCGELLERGAPIRLTDDQPVIGRFFADTCSAVPSDDPEKETILVQFGGPGFAWNQATGKLGFKAYGLMELAPDFRIQDEALYVYFRPVHVDTSSFELVPKLDGTAATAAALLQLDPDDIGRSIIAAQLGRGFTVVRYDVDGHSDFALGLLELGKRPFRPYTVVSSSRQTLANGRTELRRDAQDLLGKFHVDEGETLVLYFHVEGTRDVDALLVPANDPNLVPTFVGAKAPLSAVPSTWSSVVSAVAPFRAEATVAPGDYYLIFDYSAALGASTPSETGVAARVDYLVQVGAPTQK